MMSKTNLALAAVALATVATLPQSATADGWSPRHKSHAHHGYAAVYHYEDSCGCMSVTYVYHRELRYTYGAYFDPRSFDETEPHYYYGPVKAYPRYWTAPTTQPY